MKKIGFIGLGNMGYPMAKNLLNDFKELVVFNRSSTKCFELEKDGATIAKDIKELAQLSDIVFLSLPGPKEVNEVILGTNGLLVNMNENKLIVDFSTIDSNSAINISNLAKQKNITYIDVPVSGGPIGVVNRNLSLMIGATQEEIIELNLEPCFEAIGKTFHYMDKRGAGSAIKIINNYMSFVAQVINAEAIVMADKLNIPLEIFYNVVTSSSGNNMILNAKKNKVLENDYQPGFALDLVMKDLELARQLCQDYQIPNTTLNLGIQFYRLAQSKGYGNQDSSSVIKVIREVNK